MINAYPLTLPAISLISVRGYVAAGRLDEAQEQPLGYVVVPLPHTGGDLFGLIVRGDSMQGAGIRDGQVVLLRRQPTFHDGDIVVALIDGQATLKRIFRHEAGYLLEPENPDYPALLVTPLAVWYDDAPPEASRDPVTLDADPTEARVLGLMVGFLSEAVFPILPSF